MSSDCRTIPASENQVIIQEAKKIDKIFQVTSILFEIPLNKAEYMPLMLQGVCSEAGGM